MTDDRQALAMSIDVEDWPQSSWDRSLPISDYSADNTRRMLDLLGDFPAARATFFVLGKFAERHPRVVAAIRHAGHEIGSHGYGHVEVFRLGRQAFSTDVARSIEAIGAAAGVRPRGYRAPDFSIVGETLWALGVLSEHGFEYDSSIFPIAKARYGIPTWPREPVRVRLQSGENIVELPLATLAWAGKRLPVAGGGYARLMPGFVLRWALSKAHRQLSTPPVYYCHPYELDQDEFARLDLNLPLAVRLHQGLGRKHTAARLRRLLGAFDCLTLSDVVSRLPRLAEVDCTPYVLNPGGVHRPAAFDGDNVGRDAE